MTDNEEKKLDVLAERIKHVGELLLETVLEPDAQRTDWRELGVRLDMVRTGMDAVLSGLEPGLMEAESMEGAQELKQLIKERVSSLAGRTAALLHAAGDTAGARRLMREAARISPSQKQRAQYDAGLNELDLYARYQHGLWLGYHERTKDAERQMRSVAKETREPVLKEAARRVLAGPRPIDKAPSLFTVNGIGTGLYGSRDEADDGTYVATYCFCVLFIPLLPLTAYRVRKVDSGSYQFFTKERLGPIALAWQRLVLASVVLGIGWVGVDSYLTSPSRLARLAFERAQAVEASGSREDALRAYREVIDTHWADNVPVRAGEAVVRLSLQGLADPCTRGSVEPAGRIVAGVKDLPSQARSQMTSTLLAERLARCAEQVGHATEADATAALALMDLAVPAAEGTALHADLSKKQAERRKALADTLVAERPLRALTLYTQSLDDAASLQAARVIIDSFGPAPSLWVEAGPQVQAFIDAARKADALREAATTYQARLLQSREAREKDAELIASGDEAKLVRALQAQPHNQELASAVARLQRDRGDMREALATLSALGVPGRMTAEAQFLYALCQRDLGQLHDADVLLTRFLAERLGPFQQVQRDYEVASRELQERLVGQARAGRIPADLDRKLEAASEQERAGIFQAWLSEQLDKDPRLEALRAEYLRHELVVPAALALGVVKLQRAAVLEGDARRGVLEEAERVFLSIRQDAEDNPSFHLGLGQVYHRLSRTEDGDKEFQELLGRKEPTLSLQVAHAYRELGLTVQAKAICQDVYDTATEEKARYTAAMLCARLADKQEEEEQWLGRGDPKSPSVQNDLLALQARRHLLEGRLEEADRAYAKVAAYHERSAKHDAVAANNAAIAYNARYMASGDIAHLRTAVGYLETSARLVPDNALVLGNLSDALEQLGQVRVLEKWVRTKVLRPSSDETTNLLSSLLEGPMRGEVLKALGQEPALRRALEVAQQAQVLAPGNTENYAFQLLWLHWNRDEAGLGVLSRRLQTLPAFDSSAQAEQRREFASGARDEQLGRRAALSAEQALATVKRAQEINHKPTLATAMLLMGESLSEQIDFESSSEHLTAMVGAYKKAEQLWPQAGLNADVTSALWKSAVLRASTKSAELARGLKEEQREYGLSLTVHRALGRPLADEVRTVLRAEPELREAVERTRRQVQEAPTLEGWIIARAAGDAELERAEAQAFARADLAHEVAIGSRLSGGLAREKAWHEVFQQGRATVAQDTP